MKLSIFALFGAAAIAPLSMAHAAPNSASGNYNGLNWKAQSTIVGQTSTGTVFSGGNPLYLGTADKYRGVVGLLMDYGAGGASVCSGSLYGNSIVTAAHCVSDGTSARPNSVTAFFYRPGVDTNAAAGFETPVYNNGAPNVTRVGISTIHVNAAYTGNVIDQNDIAVLRLGGDAPTWAVSYDLFTEGDLTGLDFNVAGYGGRSTAGGSVGVNAGTGRLRQGDNRFDFRLGDADFNGLFSPAFFGERPGAQTDFSYIADFDNGLAARDASCGLATSSDFGLPGLAASAKYCNLGRGATEVTTAGGDSGGPQFINGKLASVTSYGLTFGQDVQPGDLDNALNDTFGELAGYVPIFIHADWINSVVPEPATWAMMIGGFGLVGGMSRRARKAALTA